LENQIDNEEQNLDQLSDEPPRLVFVVTDLDNPASAVNLTVNIPTVHAAIKRVMAEEPELLTKDETWFKQEKRLTVTASRIRMSFWMDYESAVANGRKMFLSRIIGGVCSEHFFKDKFLSDNAKVAFMVCPPSNYLVQTREALMAGLETLREIVSAKVVDEDGILIPRAADVVLKAVMHLDMRVKGAIVQRIDSRTLALNVNQNMSPNHSQLKIPRTLEELDAQLEQIKSQLHLTTTQPPMLDTREMRESVEVKIEKLSGAASGAYRVNNEE